MNRIIISSILALSLIVCSCNEDIIDLVPIGDTEGTFFQNEEQMDMAVFGIYQKNCFFYTYNADQNNTISPVFLLPSDDITMPGDNALENFVQLSDGNNLLSSYYQYAYQLIARANVVLEKIEAEGDAIYQLKPDQKNWNKGEALFLRAYMHINLWNIFGTVPVITKTLPIDEAYLPSSKGTELLDQAIVDLEEAAKLLPAGWEAKYKGRVTRNSALGLRGKALVFRGTVNKTSTDFTSAITDFNAISGVSLTSTYGQNFEAPTENNVESLFEYQADNNSGDNNPWLNSDDFAVIGDISHYTGMFNMLPNWIGNTHYTATTPLIDAYEDGDPRKVYNIDLEATGTVNIMKYIRNSAYPGWTSWMGCSSNNPRILRYADVLLLKAEAIVRSGGNLSEAIGLINQIRARARNSAEDGTPSAIPANRNVAETDRSKVLEWVFQERRLELAFEEGHRWWDLRRRQIAGEIDLKTYNFGSLNGNFNFRDHNLYFPIPGREVVDNPNLKQNNGY